MARLGDIAKACKSKNAGPFELTLDIMFGDAATFERVRATGVITPALIARLYNVAESAVVGFPHDIKGQGIYAYVICKKTPENEDALRTAIIESVNVHIGRIAKPDFIQFVPGLPKTRSGKIMRRILRKIAEGDVSNLGDTSTLLDPEVVNIIRDGAMSPK